MKLKLSAVLLAIAGLFVFAGESRAESVTVSSSAVTTVVSSNSGRRTVCLQNATTGEVYFSKNSSSATANAGMILRSSATVPTPFCLEGFNGPVYGLAAPGASGTVKYHETLR